MTPPIKALVLPAILLLTACAASKFQSYFKADQPLYDAIAVLQNDPNNRNAQNALPVLYQQTIKRHEIDILKEKFADHPTRYDRILARLEALQHIYQTIRSVPAAYAIVKPKNYAFEASRTEGELWAFLDEVLKTDLTEQELRELEREREQQNQ